MTVQEVYDAVIWLAAEVEENPEFAEANREVIQNIIDCVNDVPARYINK